MLTLICSVIDLLIFFLLTWVSLGEPQTFTLKFKRAEDYPIDLYYLMDLSYSMKDDLENVKSLGTELMYEMKRITSDFRIGRNVGKISNFQVDSSWPSQSPLMGFSFVLHCICVT